MEEVILVNEQDEVLGYMEKMQAHQKAVLHRAFSVFVFNAKGEMLLQQRALSKYHSGGLWTNTCCSHPRKNEETLAAACRRLREEMGFSVPLHKIFHFIYKASFDNGLTEHEFDHVYAGIYEEAILFNENEVAAYRYQAVESVKESIQKEPELYTAWFLMAFPKVYEWWKNNHALYAKK
jgi:isopentenyl-diphosphate Delta-isomerase